MSAVLTMPPLKRIAPICKDRGGFQMIVSYRSTQPRGAVPHFVFHRACYFANKSSKMLAFETALPHIDRFVRIHRDLRMRNLDHQTAPERLECLQRSVMLVDGAARVLFANAAARTLLGCGVGLTVKAGYLHGTDHSDTIQGLIASCTPKAPAPNGPGGEISIHRDLSRSPLRVTVTPLRSKGIVAELPWLGWGIPVAIVTVIDPAREKRMN